MDDKYIRVEGWGYFPSKDAEQPSKEPPIHSPAQVTESYAKAFELGTHALLARAQLAGVNCWREMK